MKSKEAKRREAQQRAKSFKYENSKAARLGTLTKEEWEKRNAEIY